MAEAKIPDFLTAVLGALFGGFGTKVVDSMVRGRRDRDKLKSDEATELRKELRAEVAGLKEENKAIRVELDVWKKKYFDTCAEQASHAAEYEVLKQKHDFALVEIQGLRSMYEKLLKKLEPGVVLLPAPSPPEE